MSTDPLEILQVKSPDSVKDGQGVDSTSGGRPNPQGSSSDDSNLVVTEDSQPPSIWKTFCNWVAALNFIAAFVGLLHLDAYSSETRELGRLLLIVGLSAGISSLMLGSIIQLLFECRNYLREIARKQTTPSYSLEKRP